MKRKGAPGYVSTKLPYVLRNRHAGVYVGRGFSFSVKRLEVIADVFEAAQNSKMKLLRTFVALKGRGARLNKWAVSK